MSNTLLIGKALVTEKTQPASRDLVILSALANRHGLITGATGTGKLSPCKRWPSSSLVLVYLYFWRM